MSEPFVAEIRMFGGNFAPRNWALCDGQLMPRTQNKALFSLLGTNFGGNGQTTFGLPDLRGRAPMHPGFGLGLSERDLGQTGGDSAVALTPAQMPSHTHTAQATDADADQVSPTPERLLGQTPSQLSYAPGSPVDMGADTLAMTGGGVPHDNMQPYLTVTFIIALVGIFPTRL